MPINKQLAEEQGFRVGPDGTLHFGEEIEMAEKSIHMRNMTVLVEHLKQGLVSPKVLEIGGVPMDESDNYSIINALDRSEGIYTTVDVRDGFTFESDVNFVCGDFLKAETQEQILESFQGKQPDIIYGYDIFEAGLSSWQSRIDSVIDCEISHALPLNLLIESLKVLPKGGKLVIGNKIQNGSLLTHIQFAFPTTVETTEDGLIVITKK